MLHWYRDLLQFRSLESISLTRGTFVTYILPPPESFTLDMIPALKGYALVPGEYKGASRFILRSPTGKLLAPSPQPRKVQVGIAMKNEHFNVVKLLASSILGRDVTDNEFGALVTETGIWIESASDRVALTEELRPLCLALPRVDLTIISLPKSNVINVAGRGYYVEGGIMYQKNGNPMAIDPNTGRVFLTDTNGKNVKARIGRILFTAYPTFYGFDPAVHDEVDHINGEHTYNEACNLRPVTKQQNASLGHWTGSRTDRPGSGSSHEIFKQKHSTLTPALIDQFIDEDTLKQYKDTSYWVHRDGAVFRKMKSGSFTYATVYLSRNGYVMSCQKYHHVMMMKTFGEHVEGKLIMHLDDNKQNNVLSNLRMGTSAENAWKTNQVTIHIPDKSPQTFVSEHEAARCIRVLQRTICSNAKRNRDRSDDELIYSKSQGILFAATPCRVSA